MSDLKERLRAAALVAMPQTPSEASFALLAETIAHIETLEQLLRKAPNGRAEALEKKTATNFGVGGPND